MHPHLATQAPRVHPSDLLLGHTRAELDVPATTRSTQIQHMRAGTDMYISKTSRETQGPDDCKWSIPLA